MPIDAAALRDHRNAVAAARARTGASPPEPGAVAVDPQRAWWRRLAASHLTERLPAGDPAPAARGGLQDSAPRAGLLALHARQHGIGPGSWEDPRLVQVWFRYADHVVPRADVAVFTLGASPRDPRQAAALEALADAVVAGLPPGGRGENSLPLDALPHPTVVRAAAVTGRIHLRWDASTIELIAADPPDADPEAARLELARRFLRWHGPASRGEFARWAGVTRPDAATTWAALAPERVAVDVAGRGAHLLAADLDATLAAEPPSGVRLLPPGDPALQLQHPAPGRPPPPLEPDERRGITKRVVNGLTGRLLVDGAVAGAWGRVGGSVTLDGWRGARGRHDEIERAVLDLAGPLGRDVELRWLRRSG